MAIGDLEDNFNWYLFDINGYSETGWQSKNNKWYYYDNIIGEMLINSWLEENNIRYLLKAAGSMAIGEIVINGVINCFDVSEKFTETKALEKIRCYMLNF